MDTLHETFEYSVRISRVTFEVFVGAKNIPNIVFQKNET
jgi:hypothetical protein